MVKLTPTIRISPTFEFKEDTVALRDAIKAANTDEAVITSIITAISNEQRQVLSFAYNANYNRNLYNDLKKVLIGRFEDVILGLIMTPIDYLCKRMHSSMKNLNINKTQNAIVESLLTCSNEEIAQIVVRYEEMYSCSLVEDISSLKSTTDNKVLMISLLKGEREPADRTNAVQAKQEAQNLLAVGQGKLHPHQEAFMRMLVHCSFAQLRLIFEEYRELAGHSIREAIKRGMKQGYDVMLSIVECVQSPPAFFATRLFKAMDGAGTDDTTLIRIIVSRSEIDLGNIKEEFERLYNRTLVSAVKSETSGDYKRALCALIGGA